MALFVVNEYTEDELVRAPVVAPFVASKFARRRLSETPPATLDCCVPLLVLLWEVCRLFDRAGTPFLCDVDTAEEACGALNARAASCRWISMS